MQLFQPLPGLSAFVMPDAWASALAAILDGGVGQTSKI